MPNLWHVVKNLATLGPDVIIKTVFVKSIVKIQYIIRNQCVVSNHLFIQRHKKIGIFLQVTMATPTDQNASLGNTPVGSKKRLWL